MAIRIRLLAIAVAMVAGAGLLLISDNVVLDQPGSLISSADARVGRPLTPMSYAGVARRTTRRAVAVGATTGAAYGAYYGAPRPGCVRVTNAYGQLYWRCP